MVDIVNHRDLAESRLATQFKESTNLIDYIRAGLKEADDLETVFQDLLTKRYLDLAEGIQLDIIGDIVGQPRGFILTVVETFFGFLGAIGSDTFGTIGDAGQGSNFMSISDEEFPEIVTDDTTYKVLIRAKISKNISRSTINETIDIVLQGISSSTIVIVSESQAEFKLTFPVLLSDEDKLLLARTNYVPKPAGVSFTLADNEGNFI